jgi:hypothetical protein
MSSRIDSKRSRSKSPCQTTSLSVDQKESVDQKRFVPSITTVLDNSAVADDSFDEGSSDDDRAFLPARWSSKIVCPSDRGTNWSTLTASKRKTIKTFDEWIDAQMDEFERMYNVMGVKPQLAKLALDTTRAALESAR